MHSCAVSTQQIALYINFKYTDSMCTKCACFIILYDTYTIEAVSEHIIVPTL